MPPIRFSTLRQLPRRSFGTLVENSVYGIAITGVNVSFGFVFWIVAARLYSARAVGLATALLAATTVASTVSNLGIGSTLIQRLPTRRTRSEWSLTINVSVILCVVSGIVASAVTVLVLPLVAKDLSVVHASLPYALTLGAAIILWTVSTTTDLLFIAERKAKYAFIRNSGFSVAKIGFLVLFAIVLPATPLALFASSIAGLLFALAMAAQIVRRRLSQAWMPAFNGVRSEARAMTRSLIGHHFINIGGYLPMYLLPLVVTARLGVVQNAWAYIGWMVGSFALVVSPTVASSLFAEGSHDPSGFGHQVRRSFGLIVASFVPLMLVILVFGRSILGAFGPAYAQHSYELVLVLSVSAIPDAITNLYVVTMRVGGRLTEAAALNIAMALSAVVMAWFLVPVLGVAGIAWSWLIAQTGGSAYAAARVAIGRIRPTDPPDTRSALPAATGTAAWPLGVPEP